MTTEAASRLSPLNSAFETGLRTLIILYEAYPARFDLQRLLMYNYLVVHSGDIPHSPASLHPPTPHRSGEVLVRRQLIEQGLMLYLSRSLVERHYDHQGITYCASELAPTLLESLEAEYTQELRERAAWVHVTFGGTTDEALKALFDQNIGRWGGEFEFESVLRGVSE